MTDLGHDLEFGVFATPEAARAGELLELASIADVSGLELFTVQDHPYQRRFLDAWTLLTAVATQTSSLRVSTNVTNLPLRPPAVLAKLVASLDTLSPGRVELGLGAGAFWDAIVAAGGPRRSPGEAVDALTEAIDILRQSWAGGTLHVRGDHYTVDGMHAGPVPTRTLPIWLGAAKPRMLRLVGTTADAWIPSAAWAPPERLTAMNAMIDEAAIAAGRSPADVRRMYNVSTGRGQVLTDDPHDWPEQLAALTLEHGLSTFILPTDDPHLLQRWSLEVAPATRALVTAERAPGAETADSVPPQTQSSATPETFTQTSTRGLPLSPVLRYHVRSPRRSPSTSAPRRTSHPWWRGTSSTRRPGPRTSPRPRPGTTTRRCTRTRSTWSTSTTTSGPSSPRSGTCSTRWNAANCRWPRPARS